MEIYDKNNISGGEVDEVIKWYFQNGQFIYELLFKIK